MDGVYDENAGAIFVLTFGLLGLSCPRPSDQSKLVKTDPVSFVTLLLPRFTRVSGNTQISPP